MTQRWNQASLDEALSEAQRDGHAVRAPEEDLPRATVALRQALYNRAKAKGEHKLFSFAIAGTHVQIELKQIKQLKTIGESQ